MATAAVRVRADDVFSLVNRGDTHATRTTLIERALESRYRRRT